ncbi:hypothetical protein [Calidifontibacillus oryziterrae]|uniref:hypothetical protein n=1 Tax=Calidifontibacillus oryziterrae TaxID=1191699 RepID=UPI0002EB38C4|nr:hypothetical protein [Calidifontibacillus oryziterrae]
MFSKTFQNRIDHCFHYGDLVNEANSIIRTLSCIRSPETEICNVLELSSKLQYIMKRMKQLNDNKIKC